MPLVMLLHTGVNNFLSRTAAALILLAATRGRLGLPRR